MRSGQLRERERIKENIESREHGMHYSSLVLCAYSLNNFITIYYSASTAQY